MPPMTPEVGFEEGAVCGREGCTGHIETRPPENCSCHISPPCSSCTAPRNFCPECDWQEEDDVTVDTFNNYVVKVEKSTGNYRSWEKRPLDPTKIDWHWASHTNASMIKEGVFPASVTKEELRKSIDGTFGGHFESYIPPENGKPGRFKFIAYTD